MQTSMVFSQLAWPGTVPAGDKDGRDVDDCAAVSLAQMVNVTAPHLRLYGVKRIRAAAGAPDRPDTADGLTLRQLARAVRALYPSIAPFVDERRGVAWARLESDVAAGRPVSVALDSAKLPALLRYGFTGRHQSTIARRAAGGCWFANPLARPYARWLHVELDDLRPAVLGFGELAAGRRAAWYLAGPTDAQVLELRTPPDETPYDADDLDELTAELQSRIDAAREALGAP